MKFTPAILAALFLCGVARAQTSATFADPAGPAEGQAPTTYRFAFRDSPLRTVLDQNGAISGAHVDIAAGVLETFTFAADVNLLRDEALAQIAAELARKRIHLVAQAEGRLRAEWIP